MQGVPPSAVPGPCFGTVVVLRGELDLLTAPAVDRLLQEATDSHPGCDLLVDLREVTFADCAGVGPLAKAAGRARERGGTVTAMVTAPRVLRLLTLTRIAEVIGVLPTLETPTDQPRSEGPGAATAPEAGSTERPAPGPAGRRGALMR